MNSIFRFTLIKTSRKCARPLLRTHLEANMTKNVEHDEFDEFDDESSSKGKMKGRSADYDKKRRRAEKILEQARLRDLFGYDIEYED